MEMLPQIGWFPIFKAFKTQTAKSVSILSMNLES